MEPQRAARPAAVSRPEGTGQRAEEQRGQRLETFGTTALTWTAPKCRCRSREDPPPCALHFYSILFFWSRLWCSRSTWTPVMSSGRTESRGVCSGSPSPCTGNSTRIRECEWCLSLCAFTVVSVGFPLRVKRAPDAGDSRRLLTEVLTSTARSLS